MKCPCCKGNGGDTEAVLDYGISPYYPCAYCDDKTKVSFRKWLWWRISELLEVRRG